MGSSHLSPNLSSGEMRGFICFLVAVSICYAGQRTKREEKRNGDGRQGMYGCCAIKAVEKNESHIEMYALMDPYPMYEMPYFCNSYCVYVKLSELKPIMDAMAEMVGNMMENMGGMSMRMGHDDSSIIEEMVGPEGWAAMQIQMQVQSLQKYCFKDSEDGQAMCVEPSMDVLGWMMTGGAAGGYGGYGNGGMGPGGYGMGNWTMGPGEDGMGSGDGMEDGMEYEDDEMPV